MEEVMGVVVIVLLIEINFWEGVFGKLEGVIR